MAALLLAASPAVAFNAASSWFTPSPRQKVTSSSTALPPTAGFRGAPQARPTVKLKSYKPPSGSLPYTVIRDNTEGAAAFADILELLPRATQRSASMLLLDVGAGRSDEARLFVEASKPGWRVVAADPYNRPAAENEAAQRAVEEAGGADVVTSMSVLNVIPEPEGRQEHIRTLRRALRPGGVAFFKVWAGLWPDRGTGRPAEELDSFQANAWASAFLPEVEAVFGKGSAYADNNLNLIVAALGPEDSS